MPMVQYHMPSTQGSQCSHGMLPHHPGVRWDAGVPEETLLEDGIPPGFPDDQICYLLDHDANKESRVACPF